MIMHQWLRQIDATRFNEVMTKHKVKNKEQKQYRKLVKHLLQKEPIQSDGILFLGESANDFNGELQFDAGVIIDGQVYAVDFTPWEEVIGYHIDEECIQSSSLEEVLYHILYDMSFDGFDEDLRQKKIDQITKGLQKY